MKRCQSIETCFFLKIVVNTTILCILVVVKEKPDFQAGKKWEWYEGPISPARPVGWDGKRGLAGNSVLLGQRTVEEICVQKLGEDEDVRFRTWIFHDWKHLMHMMHFCFSQAGVPDCRVVSSCTYGSQKTGRANSKQDIFQDNWSATYRNWVFQDFIGFGALATWSQPLKPRRRSHPWDGSRQHHLTPGPKGYWGNAEFSRLAAMLLALS